MQNSSKCTLGFFWCWSQSLRLCGCVREHHRFRDCPAEVAWCQKKELCPSWAGKNLFAGLRWIYPDIVWMAPNVTQLRQLSQHQHLKPKGQLLTRSIREAVLNSHSDDSFLHNARDRFTAMKYAYGHIGQGSGTFVMLDLTAIRTDPLLFGHRWTCQGPIQPPNTTILPPGTATENLIHQLRRSTQISHDLVQQLAQHNLTPQHVIQMHGYFYQPTNIIHDLSTEEGRTENQILNGSREHNFARRDFEIILDVPYLNVATHILTSLDIKPLDLPRTTHDADSILEHADTTALGQQNSTVADAFEHSLTFRNRGPTQDKRRVLALSTDASKTDSTNHGILATSAETQQLPRATHTAKVWGSMFESERCQLHTQVMP